MMRFSDLLTKDDADLLAFCFRQEASWGVEGLTLPRVQNEFLFLGLFHVLSGDSQDIDLSHAHHNRDGIPHSGNSHHSVHLDTRDGH